MTWEYRCNKCDFRNKNHQRRHKRKKNRGQGGYDLASSLPRRR